jgi:magnesium transporter
VAEVPIEDVGEWSRKPGHLVWVGLHEPGLDLLRRLQAEFGLHELAIEDALKAHQRPKVEQHGDALFVVARTAQPDGRGQCPEGARRTVRRGRSLPIRGARMQRPRH